MSWETGTWGVVKINGETIEETDVAKVKEAIIRKARELGYARFDVKVNGTIVTPTEFDSAFRRALESGEVDIEILPADKAA